MSGAPVAGDGPIPSRLRLLRGALDLGLLGLSHGLRLLLALCHHFASVDPVLKLTREMVDQMVAHCLRGLPYEACGLFAGGAAEGEVRVVYPTSNAAHSALLYSVDPQQHLRADRDAEGRELSIMGVFHSHTHTEAYPSPTDVAQAPDPSWHYVIVSLRESSPSIRSYRISEGAAIEEQIELM